MSEFTDTMYSPSPYRKLRLVSRILSLLVIAIGILVLLGWIFDITFLKGIRSDTIPMNPVVAIGFIAAGIALWLQQEEHSGKYNRITNLLAYFLLLIGVLKLISLITGLYIPYDELLFRKDLWIPSLQGYRTIAPNTAINLTLAGLALRFINYETKSGRRPSQYMAIAITLLGLLSLYGYLYGVPALYDLQTFVPMSINTAFCFLFLGFGILFSRADKGSMAIVIGESSGQIIFMRFIAFLLPLIYGYLKIKGENAGLFSREFGTALFAILTYMVSMFFLARQSVLQHKIRETRRQAMEAIKENERRLQAILDHSATNISLKTLLGKYTLVNKQFEKDFNLTEESALGKTDYDLFPKKLARELNKYDHKIIRTGRPKSFEEKYPQDDGIHTYLTVKFPLFTKENKIYALGAVSTDITKRKRLEEELRQSEERYSLALKGTNDGLWDWDIAGNYLFLSERWKNMLGYEEDEIPNTIEAWENQLHPDDREKTLKAVQDYFDKKIPVYEVEFRMRHKDGTYRWMLDRGMALWDEKGKPYRMVGYQTDLTERKRLEEELRQSEERYALAIKGTNDGLWDWDISSNYLFMSARLKNMLGFEEDELPNTIDAWEKQLHPDDHDKAIKVIDEYFDGKIPEYINEFRMIKKDGSIIWMLSRGMALWDEEGKPYRMIGYQTDLTERKRLEAELRKSHQRLFSILDNIGEGVIVVDKDGNLLIFNRRAEEILGTGAVNAPLEDWNKVYGFYHEDGRSYFSLDANPLFKAVKGQTADNVEMLVKNEAFQDGKWIAVTGRPVIDLDKEVIAGVIVFRDISLRKQLEKNFRENERRLKAILSSIGEGVIIIDQHEHILLFNKKAEELLGVGPKDLPLAKWPEFYGMYNPDGEVLFPAVNLPLALALQGEIREDVEVLIKNNKLPEGKNIFLSGKPIRDSKGRITGAIADFKDITEQRKLEEYLKEIEDQIFELLNQHKPKT